MNLKVVNGGKTPTREGKHLELYANARVNIQPHSKATIALGVAIEPGIDDHLYLELHPSRHMANSGIIACIDTIELSRARELTITLHNLTNKEFKVLRYVPVAYIIVQEHCTYALKVLP